MLIKDERRDSDGGAFQSLVMHCDKQNELLELRREYEVR